MKFIYVTHDFPPNGHAASYRAQSFVDRLIEDKNQVKIITQRKSDNLNEYSIENTFSRRPSNKLDIIKRSILEFIFSFEIAIRILFNAGDKVVISTPPFLMAVLCTWICRLKQQSYILDIRDIYPEVFFYAGLINRKSLWGKMLLKIETNMYKNAEKILTVTDAIQDLVQKKIDNKKVATVRNGYNSEIFSPSKEKYEYFTIICHGKLGIAQNVELLREIIVTITKFDQNINFIIVGDGKKSNLISNLKLSNLQYFNFIKHTKLANIINKCHIGLSLLDDSKIGKTAFPLRVFEYIGSGIPVLVTPRGEAGYFIEKNNLGKQFDCSEKSKIIAFLKKMSQDNYLHESLTQHTLEAREKFSRKHQADKFLSLSNDACS